MLRRCQYLRLCTIDGKLVNDEMEGILKEAVVAGRDIPTFSWKD